MRSYKVDQSGRETTALPGADELGGYLIHLNRFSISSGIRSALQTVWSVKSLYRKGANRNIAWTRARRLSCRVRPLISLDRYIGWNLKKMKLYAGVAYTIAI